MVILTAAIVKIPLRYYCDSVAFFTFDKQEERTLFESFQIRPAAGFMMSRGYRS